MWFCSHLVPSRGEGDDDQVSLDSKATYAPLMASTPERVLVLRGVLT